MQIMQKSNKVNQVIMFITSFICSFVLLIKLLSQIYCVQDKMRYKLQKYCSNMPSSSVNKPSSSLSYASNPSKCSNLNNYNNKSNFFSSKSKAMEYAHIINKNADSQQANSRFSSNKQIQNPIRKTITLKKQTSQQQMQGNNLNQNNANVKIKYLKKSHEQSCQNGNGTNNVRQYFSNSNRKISHCRQRYKTDHSPDNQLIMFEELSLGDHQLNTQANEAKKGRRKVVSVKRLTNRQNLKKGSNSNRQASKSNSSKCIKSQTSSLENIKNKKGQNVGQSNNPQHNQKYIGNLNDGLDILKSKLKSKDKDKRKKKYQSNSASKNLTISNLSRILQENQEKQISQETNRLRERKLEMYQHIGNKINFLKELIKRKGYETELIQSENPRTNNCVQLNQACNWDEFSFVDILDPQNMPSFKQTLETQYPKSTRYTSKTDFQTQCKILSDQIGIKIEQFLFMCEKNLNIKGINTSRTVKQYQNRSLRLDTQQTLNQNNILLSRLLRKYQQVIDTFMDQQFRSQAQKRQNVHLQSFNKKVQKANKHEANTRRKMTNLMSSLIEKNSNYQKGLNQMSKSGIDIEKYFK